MGRWEKLQATISAPAPQMQQGKYFVATSWSDWTFTEMSEQAPGEFATEVVLYGMGGEFTIVRNYDWDQSFYPSVPMASEPDTNDVCGPDDRGAGLHWYISGRTGDVFRIQFTRGSHATGG